MTDYITIHGVKKRSFVIQAKMPEIADTSVLVTNGFDIRITRAGDTRITRGGDTRITRSTATVHPRVIGTVKKRSFVVHAKVKNG